MAPVSEEVKKTENALDEALETEEQKAKKKKAAKLKAVADWDKLIAETKKTVSSMKATRDHHVYCPPHADVRIKEGDDCATKCPPAFWPQLKTEGVIK